MSGPDSSACVPLIERIGRQLRERVPDLQGRPFVTVSYAQSLDGSIAEIPDHPLTLSGELSLALAHSLRAAHDAILVGIGTVLADNPSLTVRYADGRNPQPVILDSRLRFPLYSRMLGDLSRPPWIFTNGRAETGRAQFLEKAGARIFTLYSKEGGNIDLAGVLRELGRQSIKSVLVEGGAQVISSFLASRLIDQFVITIAPVLIGGVRAFETGRRIGHLNLPRLAAVHKEILGDDIVVMGTPYWD